MTSFVSGDSTFMDAEGNTVPIFNSPLVAQDPEDGGISANTSGTGLSLELTIIGDSEATVYTDQESSIPDTINSGDGNDDINVGGGDDFVDGGDGGDLIFGGSGNDTIRGGKGADIIFGGSGADEFLIIGDPVDGALGADSDLIFGDGGITSDNIIDFNDNEDTLVLENMQLPGGASVSYDVDTGAVTLTDDTSGVSRVIATLQPGLDITVIDQGDGNFTLM
ncbi:hypothetical protein Xen7305DRAFT_00048030 [Xenococcus sp. PCC 7305]|uniref:calcium-binding protein n=1 Tax=Xenococcus sp. PCC 7305 TaxID=102125 RepID=UPI0002ACC2CB|nr:hypothetical protein [Xenococcus sp. PCC 7305]ELS05064.1 hypothetical protein Xen7305DRAFT_00048030 [Xenococcus sp. PCC 7305]